LLEQRIGDSGGGWQMVLVQNYRQPVRRF